MSGTRFIEIAKDPARLSLRTGCLVVQREGVPDVMVPVFELSAVVLAHPRTSITQPAMDALMGAGVPLLVCNASMLPSGLMLPLDGHSLQTQRMIAHAAMGLSLKKRVWQQVVKTKILAQAVTLEGLHGDDGGLRNLAATVRSGDPKNVEATAAQRYWPLVFRDPDFRRRFDAPGRNALLNYGYAILRACMARAICAAGLHPSLGVHHHHRENAFCLADDLFEPYRPLVDAEVAKISGESGLEPSLDSQSKLRLVELLELRLQIQASLPDMRSVSECMGATAFSFAQSLGEPAASARLVYPLGLTQW